MNEETTDKHICEAAAWDGVWLQRNNVGVLLDKTGRPVRYGLCNETPEMNKNLKSSDRIGITPIIVTQEMVGTVIGVYTAVETKKSDWIFDPSDSHTAAQLKYMNLVVQHGGYAGFARNIEDYKRIVRK